MHPPITLRTTGRTYDPINGITIEFMSLIPSRRAIVQREIFNLSMTPIILKWRSMIWIQVPKLTSRLKLGIRVKHN